jgi:hypothetical protein
MTGTEDLLRAAMARFTEDVRVPSGLPARAARHLRRRRAAVAASIAASLAALTAAAAALTAAGPGPDTQAQTAAYVLSRTEAALAAVSQQNFIQAIHQTLSGGRGSESVWWYGQQERLASYGPGGRLTLDSGNQVAGNQEIFTDVDYDHRTWDRWTITIPPVAPPSSAPPPCAEAGLIQGMGLPGPDDWATEFRTALSCGVYKVAGTEQVNGTHLIKLTPAHPAPATTVFWIDTVTYLPVRAEIVYGTGDTDNEVQDVEVFQWLPPTAANLKNLDVPIPAGFTRVPPPKN